MRMKMFNILYEDNHVIVVIKPRGVLSQSDGSDKLDMLTELKKYIKVKYDKPGDVYLGLVHRLDTNTCGIMVFARTSKAASRLSESIKQHDFQKKYLAVVSGYIEPSNNYKVLENNLLKDEQKRIAKVVKFGGQKAKLEYKSLETVKFHNKDFTLVDINLLTGRFHQIRAQFSHIYHPLYGDIKYNGEKNKDFFLALQAYNLSFIHPVKKEEMVFNYIDKSDIFGLFSKIKAEDI